MRQLYLAATGQNRGKTTAALGLVDGFIRRGYRTGFMKPVGQRTVMEEGTPADEDAVLMRAVFDLPEPYPVMSPVHIPRGFTKAYIAGEVVEDLGARIRRAHEVFHDHDVLLVEGTGHAGVGAVIGLSNAVVAAALRAPAVIVSEGGVGRPIDEIVLNAALFERQGVPVAGAIVNKVDVVAQPGIRSVLERGLAPHGIALLGVLPVRPLLSNPTLEMIEAGLDGELIHSGPDLDRVIDDVAIAAMEPRHALEHVGPGTLVIVPGDREDVITTLAGTRLAGLVLTGGYPPRSTTIEAIHRANLFAVIVAAETYAVASKIHDLLVKTHPADREKIELIKQLVGANLDVDRILDVATEPAAA
ncbi:MAG TPA: AAA family ATPase [Candidatus Limnocylindrales bacterium]|nr:AAA family ATPase [Candidatus Limnocylindrales bacterium]